MTVMALKTNNMKKAPFKMKGDPMKRNFGISPVKDKGREVVEEYASGQKEVTVSGDTRSAEELLALANKAEKAGNKEAADKMRAKAKQKQSNQKDAQNFLKNQA